ncbi:DUF2061 domain-containing protein [Bizionia sediminis]|uniref:DUF2061 domain-containing protein n=1 Tax=Bizionia sediminis TaxID=1737064 RepID=A0ABW5KUD5_9FLAO
MNDISYRRHLAKTITWRLVGTADTILLSWIITGNPFVGIQLGIAEVTTKSILYYIHERIWYKINLTSKGVKLSSKKRHVLKTITWRVIGTLDTVLLAWFISGSTVAALQIGTAEVVTKMLLYYMHERVWYKINFGLANRKNR